MTSPGNQQVPNPELAWLRALLTRVQSAQSEVPDIDGPTGSIGPGPAWTGTRALAVHDQQLAPVAGQFKQALNALDTAVQEKINSTPATVTANVAKLMRLDHEWDR